jgi:single-stranded-DNA-specific exonuclease
MELAVERLLRAVERDELVVIFGDYDVDGVTSTVILLEVLRGFGVKAEWYVPHRLDEGYGLTSEAVENCLQKHSPSLLVAVDCGSSSVEVVARLKERGVEVIILDHHQACTPGPAAAAFVNPHAMTKNGEGQFQELCSAGLAFKLAHALVKRGREKHLAAAEEFDVRKLLDLVALGTIADVVPLSGENRILVTAGLERLNRTQRPGLVALKQVAQCPAALGTYEVGFQLAPRLNAAGRMESAAEALSLLLAGDLSEAMPLAERLDARNRERQKIERGISRQVIESVRAKFSPGDDFVIVEGQSPWHVGVVGIVAARVLQQFYRPTIILGGAEGVEWRGSGRSIAGFDLAEALRECSDLLVRHGGHAMAAGVTIQATNVEAFRLRLNEVARRSLKPEALQAPLQVDAQVGLEEVSLECLHGLERIKPVGQGNPSIHFSSRNVTHQRPLQRMGAEKQHVKMWVTDGTATREAVWWGAGNESLPVGTFELAFAPKLDHYTGKAAVQLKVLDWRG